MKTAWRIFGRSRKLKNQSPRSSCLDFLEVFGSNLCESSRCFSWTEVPFQTKLVELLDHVGGFFWCCLFRMDVFIRSFYLSTTKSCNMRVVFVFVPLLMWGIS